MVSTAVYSSSSVLVQRSLHGLETTPVAKRQTPPGYVQQIIRGGIRDCQIIFLPTARNKQATRVIKPQDSLLRVYVNVSTSTPWLRLHAVCIALGKDAGTSSCVDALTDVFCLGFCASSPTKLGMVQGWRYNLDKQHLQKHHRWQRKYHQQQQQQQQQQQHLWTPNGGHSPTVIDHA